MKCYLCGTTEHLRKFNKYSYACRPCAAAKQKEYYDRVRAVVFRHYGNKCACCSEDTEPFLTIDHINNDGHLELNGNGGRLSGRTFYARIIKNGFPDTYQLLCMNCNFGKRMNNGVCPHIV